MPPAAVDRVNQGRTREAIGAVAPLVDAVLHQDGQVLVAAEMNRPGAANFLERAVAAGLRPAVAIEIRQQPRIALAVHVDRAAECRLRQHGLDLGAGPVLPPRAQEAQLPLAEQLQTR
jgi:hypothetical protein